MNPWLQAKQYRCPKCHTIYLHDQAHAHASYECPFRPAARLKAWLEEGRRYEPVAEKNR